MGAIWFLLLAVGLVVAAIQGRVDAFTKGALDGAVGAVTIAIGLIGVMALWLGLMKIAEEAGLIASLARLLRPVLRRLFPEVPADHPALGAIVLNISANALGLGNAATPMGIKAMEELQRLNPHKEVATNAMVLFLAINTSSVQLIPATVIALRTSAGAERPYEVIGPTLLATACSTIVGIAAAILLSRTRLGRMP